METGTTPEEAYWHATPLHYAPRILHTGALWCADRLAAEGVPVRPRKTSARRDKPLGLSGYVHLSPRPHTPLLADKIRRGIPHALIAFAPGVADLPGAAWARYDAAAFRHRDDFVPITDPDEVAALRSARADGRYPSAALLIPDALPLAPHAVAVYLLSADAAAWLGGLVPLCGLPGGVALRVSPGRFPSVPDAPAPDLAPHHAWADACRAAGRLLPPPDLPVD